MPNADAGIIVTGEDALEPTLRPRVKVCCIGSVEEAWSAIRCGACALGLVSEIPSGPGVISYDQIAAIAAAVPPGVGTFLLTSSQDAEEIIAQQRYCRTNTVQICDRLMSGNYTDLRRGMPGIALVQVIHVSGLDAIHEAVAVARQVDALLLDSGNQAREVKELGGTGRVHDWTISRRIREQVPKPIFLAGGLTAVNATEAVKQVGPFGLDLCSGIRTEGILDVAKLNAFFSTLQKDDAA